MFVSPENIKVRRLVDSTLDDWCLLSTFSMLAMLVDLDRSRPIEQNLNKLHYQASVTYTISPDEREKWTCGMLDWRQVAIMISYVYQERDIKNYHQMKFDDDLLRDGFVEQLLKGKYTKSIILNIV